MSVETSTTILRSPSQSSSKDGVFRDGPRSLIISPNLDALLEHEERVNRGARSATCMGLSSSPIAVSPTGSEGLPPPPRGHRKTRPKCEGAEDIPLPMSPIDTNWPASNPYINPAPSLAEVLGNSNESRRSSMAIHDNTTRIENEHDNENGAGGRTAETAGMTQGPGDGRDACDNKDRHPSQQSQSRYVERLFSLSRTAFRLRFDGTIQKNQNAQLPSPTNIRDRARLRGKLIKPKDIAQSTRPVMEDLPVFDIRRFGGGPGNPLNPQHEGSRRPLHSHAPSSRSPTASHRSSSSTSTTRPSSTFNLPDPRISISSTIYPSSSHSHSHTLYDTAESPPFLSSTKPLARHRTSPSTFERHSFIEILSPSSPAFPSIDTPQPSEGDMNLENFWSGRTRFSSAPSSRDRSSSPKPPKPPIPTSPKPNFNRSKRASPEPTPAAHHPDLVKHRDDLPPTTNFLDMDERADLVRKSRKLAQMFGQPPEAESLSQQDKPTSVCPTVSNLKQKHHRGALSMTNDIETSILRQQMPSIQSHAQSLYDSAPTGRRYSIPLSPDEMSFMDDIAGDGVSPSKSMVGGYFGEKLSSDLSAQRAQTQPRSLSPTSFIDISDEEVVDDGTPVAMGSKQVGKRRSISPSRQSLYENMSPEDQAEEERRRRREKLAKLHRFLGSRVPTNLVLGFDIPLALPPLPDTSEASMNTQAGIGEARKVWLRRRRSSSAAAFPSTWSDEVDRLKEDLNDREKAINVRRAQKMEKVFGVAPPQTLYHTRHSPSPSVPAAIIGPPRTSSKHVSGRESPVGSPPPLNNANTSAHTKSRTRRNDRPSTSGSDVPLISTDKNNDNPQRVGRNSLVYTHYQHSLKSLSDILDRDDKESLAELHQYLNTVEIPASPAIQEFSKTAERRPSVTSLKSERRRSLPARTSLISIASEYSMAVASPKPDVTDFQLRRRRAAKLTQFFGVDYRDLINDVLESIENGLEHERKRGTLRADEVEDLLLRLRNLRTKRGGME